LTIEAMDIAHLGHIDTIVLVTRDRDFTPLALRLRQYGMAVWGFAESEPSAGFRAACSSFELVPRPAPPPVAQAAAATQPAIVAKASAAPKPAAKAAVQPKAAVVLETAARAKLLQIAQQ